MYKSYILAICLVLFATSSTLQADDAVVNLGSGLTGSPGQAITVPVYIDFSKVPVGSDVVGYDLQLDYDHNIFDLSSTFATINPSPFKTWMTTLNPGTGVAVISGSAGTTSSFDVSQLGVSHFMDLSLAVKPGVSAQATTLKLEGLEPTQAFFAYDPIQVGLQAGTATVQINSVPEPSSMALLAMAGVAGVSYFGVRRRRNRAGSLGQ
jgi:hypothetical protein